MSSDLLKEFGDQERDQLGQTQSPTAARDISSEKDDFGDFEEPESSETTQETCMHEKAVRGSSTRSLEVQGSEGPALNAHPRSHPQLLSFGDSFQPSSNTRRPPTDSHQGELTSDTMAPITQISELFQHGPPSPLTAPIPPRKEDEWGDFVDESVLFDADQEEKPKGQTPTIRTDTNNSDLFDAWEPVNITQPTVTPKKPLAPDATQAAITKKTTQTSAPILNKTPGPPPTNIPPPSVLISVLAILLQSLSTAVKNILIEDRASSDPYEAIDQPCLDQLQQKMSLLRASAKITAGRKLRWKRDTLLSQSMKIGPAGKPGGMKLTGVDKTESRREDQEVAEALRVWKQQVGQLRSTIAMINVHLPGVGLKVPEIAENMPIRVAKASDGAVFAAKPCFLCGIKRDERVEKVDVDVEDSFGEWWIEHWGHLDCVVFWDKQKSLLPQR